MRDGRNSKLCPLVLIKRKTLELFYYIYIWIFLQKINFLLFLTIDQYIKVMECVWGMRNTGGTHLIPIKLLIYSFPLSYNRLITLTSN